MSEFLSVKQAAQLLRRSETTVRRYIRSGKLEAVRVGRHVRVPREAVEALMVGEATDFREPARPLYRTASETESLDKIAMKIGFASPTRGRRKIEVVEQSQLEEGYAILDKLVGFCQSNRTDASINHDEIVYELGLPG
ncbi:MAG: helix-turn-helix domain-containing protein [Chloroflexi bacterium]|nr:helix-turn-helix domain-containing protein [Chloroflexota bacterium]